MVSSANPDLFIAAFITEARHIHSSLVCNFFFFSKTQPFFILLVFKVNLELLLLKISE